MAIGRREFLRGRLAGTGVGLLAGCGVRISSSTPPARLLRIGYLAMTNAAVAEFETFCDGLRELGYVEGQNIAIDVRLAGSPDELPRWWPM